MPEECAVTLDNLRTVYHPGYYGAFDYRPRPATMARLCLALAIADGCR